MSIFNHETDEEISEARFTAEQMLDKIYHAIPEWVHRQFPKCSLAEKVQKGFEYQQKQWAETYLRETEAHQKMQEFTFYLKKTHGLNLMKDYWNFLVSKDMPKADETEKKVLTKMKK
jgi:hypothetical protein